MSPLNRRAAVGVLGDDEAGRHVVVVLRRALDLEAAPLQHALGAVGVLADPVADRDRLAALGDDEVDDRAGPQRGAGLGVRGDHDALGHGLGELRDLLAEGQVGVDDLVLRLVDGQVPELRQLVGLLAERDDDRDRVAVEDPLTGAGVGADHPAALDRRGVVGLADHDLEPGALEALDRVGLGQADHAGDRRVARVAEPPGAGADGGGDEQGEHQQDRSAPRPAGASRLGARGPGLAGRLRRGREPDRLLPRAWRPRRGRWSRSAHARGRRSTSAVSCGSVGTLATSAPA